MRTHRTYVAVGLCGIFVTANAAFAWTDAELKELGRVESERRVQNANLKATNQVSFSRQGALLFQQGKYQEAAKYLFNGLTDSRSTFLLGQCYIKLNRFEDAKECFKRVISSMDNFSSLEQTQAARKWLKYIDLQSGNAKTDKPSAPTPTVSTQPVKPRKLSALEQIEWDYAETKNQLVRSYNTEAARIRKEYEISSISSPDQKEPELLKIRDEKLQKLKLANEQAESAALEKRNEARNRLMGSLGQVEGYASRIKQDLLSEYNLKAAQLSKEQTETLAKIEREEQEAKKATGETSALLEIQAQFEAKRVEARSEYDKKIQSLRAEMTQRGAEFSADATGLKTEINANGSMKDVSVYPVGSNLHNKNYRTTGSPTGNPIPMIAEPAGLTPPEKSTK